jgi:hypothetical protein
MHMLIDAKDAEAYARSDRSAAQITDSAKGLVLRMMAERPSKELNP